MRKVWIAAPAHDILRKGLEAEGYELVDYIPATTAEALAFAPGITGIITSTRLTIDQTLLDAATDLKWIGRLGSGMELIDVAYAEAKGIKCYSSPEGNCNAVAEQALGMLLCLSNNILKSNLQLRKGQWEREGNRGWELEGKTIGIIGYGHTGEAFARKLKSLDVRILAHDKYRKGFGDAQVAECSLADIQREADIISFHLPLTNETFHYMNEDFLVNCLKSLIVINTSRGNVVKTSVLKHGIESGKIKGLCLDVIENESVKNYTEADWAWLNWLLEKDNVVLTPHVAGYSHEANEKMGLYLLRKILTG